MSHVVGYARVSAREQNPAGQEADTPAAILTCFGVVASPVALGLGIAALRRLPTNGKRGRGLAITGVITGGIGTAIVLLLLVGTIIDPTMWSKDDRYWAGAPCRPSGPLVRAARTTLVLPLERHHRARRRIGDTVVGVRRRRVALPGGQPPSSAGTSTA